MFTFDDVRRGVNELGERVIGRGKEVDFRKQVERIAASRGLSREQAQKEALDFYIQAVNTEATSGFPRGEKANLSMIEAGLIETIGRAAVKALTKDESAQADLRAISLPVAPSRGEMDNARKALTANMKAPKLDAGSQAAFERRIEPSVQDAAMDVIVIRELTDRMHADMGATGDNVEDMLASRPEFRADMHAMLHAKKLLDTHEHYFKMIGSHKRAIESLKTNALEAINNILGKGIVEWGKNVPVISLFTKGKLLNFGGFFTATAKYLGKAGASATKLGKDMLWVGGRTVDVAMARSNLKKNPIKKSF
jgi:hypothetical protein